MEKGAKVRTTVDELGAVTQMGDHFFAGDAVPTGTEATIEAEDVDVREPDWYYLRLEDGRFIPAHVSMFEEVQ